MHRNGQVSPTETDAVVPEQGHSAAAAAAPGTATATSHVPSVTSLTLKKFGDSANSAVTSDKMIKSKDGESIRRYSVKGNSDKARSFSGITEKSGVLYVTEKSGEVSNVRKKSAVRTGSKQDRKEKRGSSGVIHLEVKNEVNGTSPADNIADENFVSHL